MSNPDFSVEHGTALFDMVCNVNSCADKAYHNYILHFYEFFAESRRSVTSSVSAKY
jgi:hypothetical protein